MCKGDRERGKEGEESGGEREGRERGEHLPNPLCSPTDDKLNLFRQQAVFVEKKKEEKEMRLKDITEEREELEKEVKAKSAQFEGEGSRVWRMLSVSVSFSTS